MTILVPHLLLGQDSTLFLEDFDDVSPPDLPTGWSSSPQGTWTSSSSVSSPGSGINNIVVSGSDSGSVFTPVLDLSALGSGVLTYSARRTSTFPSSGLIVEASTDNGQTFPIVVVDSGAALPSVASDYETISATLPPVLIGATSVQFRFRAFGNGGGNCRIDDIVIAGSGEVGLNSFGFASQSSIAAIGADSFRVDLSLKLIPSATGLHGLQFDLTWPDTEEIIAVEKGAAIVDQTMWEVTAQVTTSPGRVVVISKSSAGLISGDYSDLITLVLAPAEDGGSARDDTLRISGIIGSRSTDTGDDAYVTSATEEHVISVLPAIASFETSTDSLDLGVIEVDSTASSVLMVGNPLGNVDLQVTAGSSISGVVVHPDTFSVAPGDSLALSVEADASILPPGPFGGHLILSHNASADPDSIWVFGTVGSVSTRGDVNDDGYADLIDLVLAVDHVVGVTTLAPELADRVDLYPFPSGDDAVDVRDLTILVRAINSGMWPDGILVPSPILASKHSDGLRAELYFVGDRESNDIRLNYAPGLRAVQLLLSSETGLEPADVRPPDLGEFVQVHVDRYRGGSEGVVGVVAYTLDGSISRHSDFTLADVILESGGTLQVLFATGVDLANERVQIDFEDGGVPDSPSLSLAPPFPQPFSLSRHERLLIQSTSTEPSEASVQIGDVLGRTVYSVDEMRVSRSNPFSWKGTTTAGLSASPGLYYVRFETEADVQTVPIVIVP